MAWRGGYRWVCVTCNPRHFLTCTVYVYMYVQCFNSCTSTLCKYSHLLHTLGTVHVHVPEAALLFLLRRGGVVFRCSCLALPCLND